MTGDPLVSIRCLVYNHEPYLRQCLDGFVMQKTTFPFEAIVHDDASTDGSAAIIREYAEKFPDIIKPIYETENQYSKHDGSLNRIMDAAMHLNSKYIAYCEGDDYWIDPNKLQLQVDFLESHPDYSMCCNCTRIYSEDKKSFTKRVLLQDCHGDMNPEEIILKGGLFIATCSILLRKFIKWPDYPSYCKDCHVSDYPLQIMCAMKGKVYCHPRSMSVYRIGGSGSWTKRQREFDLEDTIKARKSEVAMLKGFAEEYPKYVKVFNDRIAYYINLGIPISKGENAVELYLSTFKKEIERYTWKWRIHLRMRFVQNKYLQYAYYQISNRLFLHRFA
jgi:glycosyltransferase involved in cell wall biosynthesis